MAKTSVRLTIPYHLWYVWQTKAKQENINKDVATQGTAIDWEEMCFIHLKVHTGGLGDGLNKDRTMVYN